MNKLTQISGLNNKLGQNSRTGSNISIFVPDELIQEVTQYYVEVKANKETLGKVKKIELVIYEDGDELETIEALRATNKDLRDFIENLDTVVKNSESLIDSVVIEEDEEEIVISDKVLLTPCNACDRKPEVGNCNLQCSVITENPEDRNLFEEKEESTGVSNQLDLPLYKDKKCECEVPTIADNGKCCNCGGVE